MCAIVCRCGESSPIRGFLFGAEGCPPALHHVLHRLRRLGAEDASTFARADGPWILPSPFFEDKFFMILPCILPYTVFILMLYILIKFNLY